MVRRGGRIEIYPPVGRKIGRDIETDDKLRVWKKGIAENRTDRLLDIRNRSAADESESYELPIFGPETATWPVSNRPKVSAGYTALGVPRYFISLYRYFSITMCISNREPLSLTLSSLPELGDSKIEKQSNRLCAKRASWEF